MSGDLFRTAKPEELSVSSEAIRLTIKDIRETNNLELHSFLMLRDGVLLWEEYFRDGERDRPHVLYSVSKSFTSSAIGLAEAQGLLTLDDKLYDFFPEYKELCDSDLKKEITLRHLLMMGSGFENNEEKIFQNNGSDSLVHLALAQPVIHKPGTVFNYYTVGTYLLSAVFNKIYPKGIHSYLRNKLFIPMGFGESIWNVDDDGTPFGGFGLHLTAYDLARFGQLYLQKGYWEGQQLLPESYTQKATTKQIDNSNHSSDRVDWSAGYGYQFWRNHMGGYRADGMRGQYIIVLPEKQTVIVMTSNLDNMQIPLTTIATHLLPAVQYIE